jgi:hypothetical protein
MLTPKHFEIFEKYKTAGAHAFSNDIVSLDDKQRYSDIHSSLISAAEFGTSLDNGFKFWNSRFHKVGGVQGQRPKDLWSAIINENSELFGRYPQIYFIANELGLEIGFSVAIHEADYYDEDIKIRNRLIVPILYRMFPPVNSDIVKTLSNSLKGDEGNWYFGVKSRQGLKGDFETLGDLVNFIKSGAASDKGGGSIYKVIPPNELTKQTFSLENEAQKMMAFFGPLMRSLTPSGRDAAYLVAQNALNEEHTSVEQFDPKNSLDGKTFKMRKMANRLGQRKFREALLVAYEGTCAISGSTEVSALQAAHISPYDGSQTNSVQNGLLLRADIHNLFDMGLIGIDPKTYTIIVSDRVTDPTYRAYDNTKIKLPEKNHQRPSSLSLQSQLEFFTEQTTSP